MSDSTFFDLMRDGLWTGFLLCLPILATALTVGVGIGLVQALTSVQELTLTFVPKLGAIMLVYWLTMSFMSNVLVDFFRDRLIPAIAGS